MNFCVGTMQKFQGLTPKVGPPRVPKGSERVSSLGFKGFDVYLLCFREAKCKKVQDLTPGVKKAGLGLSFLCFAQAKCKKVQDLTPGVKKGSLSLSFLCFAQAKMQKIQNLTHANKNNQKRSPK